MNLRREGAEGARLGVSTRWTMLGLALALTAVFAVARALEPSPQGFGTHTQLGLPACQFALVTGHPCPSCGMTTAFAWFVRGRLGRSWGVNPAGMVLALACVGLIPWLIVGSALGKTPGFRSLEQPLLGVVVATVAVSLVTWTIRLILPG